MKRKIAVLAVAAAPFTFLPAIAAAGSKARPSLAVQLSQHMVRALNAQTRIVVRGWTVGPGTMKTTYVMRYLAGGREYLAQRGGPWGHVQIHGKRMAGVTAIYIGKQAFTTMDQRHWYRSSRPSPPTPLDAISLKMANTPCCVPNVRGASVKLSDGGTQRWHGVRVHVVNFSTFANGYVVTGHVLLDMQSYLPLGYVQNTRVPQVSGQFTLSYGGSFTISAPR